jgi:hypothetical protein
VGLMGSQQNVFTNIANFAKQMLSPVFEAVAAFKNENYADAAKALGKTAFNMVTAPHQLAMAVAKGI